MNEQKTTNLTEAIEKLFPYSGSMDRQSMSPAWLEAKNITPKTYALKARGHSAEQRLKDEMYRLVEQAARGLGQEHGIGIVWRRTPFFVTDDDGTIILKMRMALVDPDGQIELSGLPVKVEGVPSRSID